MSHQDVLTAGKILARTKLTSLSEVRNLNLWGNDFSDIRVLRECPNVEVLSLSVNQIRTLADLADCSQLRELYLRKNKIADLTEILYLVHLPHLRILWLSENPCCSAPNYREFILSKLPHLQKLDNTDIAEEEREMATKQLKPGTGSTISNTGSGEFLSPRAAAALARFGSPRSSSNRQEGQQQHQQPQSHRSSAFNFNSSSARLSSPVASSPAKASYDDIISPRRSHATATAAAAAAAAFSPRNKGRIYAHDDVALASPTRAAFPHGQFSPATSSRSGASTARPRIHAALGGEEDSRLLSPRQYTVLSPSGTVYSPSNRAKVPPLNFQSVGGHKLTRSPVARALAVSDFAASSGGGGKEGAPAASNYEAATRRRTEALEEEIRLLRAAEETERRTEREAHRASIQRALSPRRNAPRGQGEVRSAKSSPSSPRSLSVGSPRAGGYVLSPRQPRSAIGSPRSSRPSTAAVAGQFALSPTSAATAGAYTGRSTTTNQSYGAQTNRPVSARPAAGEKPNPIPAFMHPAPNHQPQTASGAGGSTTARRPQTAAVGTDPKSPRGVAPLSSGGAPAAPLSPRSHFAGPPAPTPSVSSVSGWSGAQMTPRSQHGRPAQGVTQHNLMCAALAMIEEFDLQHLQWLQKAIDAKMQEAQHRR